MGTDKGVKCCGWSWRIFGCCGMFWAVLHILMVVVFCFDFHEGLNVHPKEQLINLTGGKAAWAEN